MSVSVIIPVFNSEPYIDGCIQVLSSQTYGDFEAIFVVDGKCTDNTLQKLQSITDTPFTIRVIKQHDDKKAGGARNIGVDNAKGDYIWFMDVDDCPCDTFVEEMLNAITETDSDVAICNFCYSRSTAGNRIPEKNYVRKGYTGLEAITALNNGKLSANIWDKMFRTSFIKDNNISFIAGCSEDYAYVLNSFLSTDKIVYYNKPLYVYYLHDDSTSKGQGDEIAKRDIEIFAEFAKKLKESDSPYYEEYCSTTIRHILHSLTNVSKPVFKELSNEEIIKESLKYRQKFSMEVFIFKLSKRLFYFIGRNARRLKYSRAKLFFDNDF